MRSDGRDVKLTQYEQITEGSLIDGEIVLIDVFTYGTAGTMSTRRTHEVSPDAIRSAELAILPYEQKFSPRATPEARHRKIMRVIAQREIVGLYDFNNVSFQKIAELRGEPLEKVRSQYKRGRERIEKLRADLARRKRGRSTR